ncbi:YncE family protein [Actinomycetospora sp. CA-101289]|uniref:YncE family protein n=1 Tax=Actinomycetospora sp. CA-101289 TaxID=3239893 RepID=UPI003D9700BF
MTVTRGREDVATPGPPPGTGARRHGPAATTTAIAAVVGLSVFVLILGGALRPSTATDPSPSGSSASAPAPGTTPAATSPVPLPGASGERTRIPVGVDGTQTLALTPDGSTLLVGVYPPASPSQSVQASTVVFLDAATGVSRGSVTTSRGILGLVVSPDGRRAYATASVDDVVDVIDVPSRTVVARVPTGDFPEGIAIAPDGSTVYVAHYGSGTVVALDTATNTVRASGPVGEDASDLALSPDGSTLVVGHDATVSVLDAATLTVRTSLTAGRDLISALTFTADGRYAFIGTRGPQTDSGEIAILYMAEMRFPRRFTTRALPLAFTAGPGVVYSAQRGTGGPGSILVTTYTGARPSPAPIGAEPSALALSPDGRLLYAVDGDEFVSVVRL